MSLIYCKECGAKISNKASVCPRCGTTQISTETTLENDVILETDSLNTNGNSDVWIKWLVGGVIAVLLVFVGIVYYPKLFQQNNEDDMLLAEWDQGLDDDINTDNISTETVSVPVNAQGLNDNNFNNNRINGHEYVDLGLSVKWATCNVGASQPYEYGDYYAWGETTAKNNYTMDNSKTRGKNMGDISGNPNYDAATANWGSGWRTPTYSEMKELDKKCTWIWTTENDINGYKVTGPNGNSIFLPAAGELYGQSNTNDCDIDFGYYWTSTPENGFDNCISNYLKIVSSFYEVGWYNRGRESGFSIRPIVD